MTDKDSFLYNILTNPKLKLNKPIKKRDTQVITKSQNVTAKYAPLKPRAKSPILGSFKKGGIVKKTGIYKLHKGEKVVPKNKRLKAK